MNVPPPPVEGIVPATASAWCLELGAAPVEGIVPATATLSHLARDSLLSDSESRWLSDAIDSWCITHGFPPSK